MIIIDNRTEEAEVPLVHGLSAEEHPLPQKVGVLWMQEFEASGAGKKSAQFSKHLKMKTANSDNKKKNSAIKLFITKESRFILLEIAYIRALHLENSSFVRSYLSKGISWISLW